MVPSRGPRCWRAGACVSPGVLRPVPPSQGATLTPPHRTPSRRSTNGCADPPVLDQGSVWGAPPRWKGRCTETDMGLPSVEAVAPREWLVHRLCAHRWARGLLLCCFVLAAPSPLSCPPPRLSHSLGRWAAEWLLVPRSVLLFPFLVSCGPQALAEEAPPPSAPSDWPGAELEVL